MSVYVVAQLRVTDPDAYGRYRARFMDVFARYGGRVLASDEAPRVVEGTWAGDRIVLLAFPDEASCRAWYESPDYRAIAVDRLAGSDSVILLVRGIVEPL